MQDELSTLLPRMCHGLECCLTVTVQVEWTGAGFRMSDDVWSDGEKRLVNGIQFGNVYILTLLRADGLMEAKLHMKHPDTH